ncbi:MAG: SMI1/KNR4 family protein [Bacteroidia bacterium]|nr:SMI1/KNR4 family protein [Bacteroidia bacterium]
METIKQLWQNFENWLSNNTPHLIEALKSGATNDDIEKAENNLGVTFPIFFKEIYQIHNGQFIDKPGIFPEGTMLPLNEIVRHWEILKQLKDKGHFDGIETETPMEIKPIWWSEKWIPIIGDGSGNFLCIDFDPTTHGKMGQIIWFEHDIAERGIVDISYFNWFDKTIQHIIEDKYYYDQETDTFEVVD